MPNHLFFQHQNAKHTHSTATKRTNDLATFVEARLGKPSHLLDGGGERLRQFLGAEGRVLRFYACWDDRGGMYGDRRPYVLHYFLEDDTVEINEVRFFVCVVYIIDELIDDVWDVCDVVIRFCQTKQKTLPLPLVCARAERARQQRPRPVPRLPAPRAAAARGALRDRGRAGGPPAQAPVLLVRERDAMPR
jgi:hypothetical protein